MFLKSLSFKFFILTLLTFVASSKVFALDEDPSGSQACKDELSKAKDDLQDLVYGGSKASNSTQTASTDANGNPTQQASANPMQQVMQQMQQIQEKQAQLAQQAAEKEQQLNNERYKQLNDINDKIHEFQRGDFKRRMAIKDAETAMKKQLAEIRIACQQKGEDDYAKEFLRLNEQSKTSNYETSDISHMSGTSKRMRASLQGYYVRKCNSNPATLEKKKLVQDEYDSKMHNFKIAAEEIQSDISYTESKIGLLEGHMAEQKAQLQNSIAQQQAALKQQQQQAMMNMVFGMMTADAGQSDEQKQAQEFRSADETLKKWKYIQEKCRNGYSDAIKIPSDIYYVFSDVNEACRGKDSGRSCVDDSNRESEDRASSTRSSGI